MKTPQNSAPKWCERSQVSCGPTLILPALLLACSILTACSTQAPRDNPQINAAWLLSGSALTGESAGVGSLPDDKLLELPPEMRTYLAGLAPGASGDVRLQALLRGFHAQDFTVEYRADATLTAAETYRQQQGNCMAFTLMMVAMARELGANAYFNQVEVPPVWGHDDPQTFVEYRHINMVSESARGRRVVDFNLAAYDPVYDQRKLSDNEAFAQYYSNRGMELMQQGEQVEAFRYLRKALQLSPGSADLWANLGALYGRHREDAAAEQSYLQALQLDATHAVAMSNLERLYRQQEKFELANYYAERARYHRARNPYYLYYLARNAYEHGDYQAAKKQLKRALWQYEDDHRFHFLLGLTSYRLGDYEDSREHLSTAFALANNPGVKQAYTRKLELLKQNE